MTRVFIAPPGTPKESAAAERLIRAIRAAKGEHSVVMPDAETFVDRIGRGASEIRSADVIVVFCSKRREYAGAQPTQTKAESAQLGLAWHVGNDIGLNAQFSGRAFLIRLTPHLGDRIYPWAQSINAFDLSRRETTATVLRLIGLRERASAFERLQRAALRLTKEVRVFDQDAASLRRRAVASLIAGAGAIGHQEPCLRMVARHPRLLTGIGLAATATAIAMFVRQIAADGWDRSFGSTLDAQFAFDPTSMRALFAELGSVGREHLASMTRLDDWLSPIYGIAVIVELWVLASSAKGRLRRFGWLAGFAGPLAAAFDWGENALVRSALAAFPGPESGSAAPAIAAFALAKWSLLAVSIVSAAAIALARSSNLLRICDDLSRRWRAPGDARKLAVGCIVAAVVAAAFATAVAALFPLWSGYLLVVALGFLLPCGALWPVRWGYLVESKQGTTAPPPPPPPPPIPPLMSLVPLKAGTFRFGSPVDERGRFGDEGPIENVRIDAFEICPTVVTRDMWRTLRADSAPELPLPTSWATDDSDGTLPANAVSWFDALRFCNAASLREKLVPAYELQASSNDGDPAVTGVRWNRSANGYRLPTEAEWEYACRAGTKTPYPWDGVDEDALSRNAWWGPNTGNDPMPVGGKPSNEFGLFDMIGNVREWCWDANTNTPDPQGNDGSIDSSRALRGGSFDFFDARILRSAYRLSDEPGVRFRYIGFRCVRGALRQHG